MFMYYVDAMNTQVTRKHGSNAYEYVFGQKPGIQFLKGFGELKDPVEKSTQSPNTTSTDFESVGSKDEIDVEIEATSNLPDDAELLKSNNWLSNMVVGDVGKKTHQMINRHGVNLRRVGTFADGTCLIYAICYALNNIYKATEIPFLTTAEGSSRKHVKGGFRWQYC
jgi:hypothetical protein